MGCCGSDAGRLGTIQIIPVSTVKATLNEYARTVANEHVRIALTRNGTADTVLISTADLESLEETIAVLSNTEAVAAMEAAVQVLQNVI